MGSVRAVALSASAQGHVGIGMLHDSSSGGASSSNNAARTVVAGTAVAQQVAVFADERMIRDRVPVTAALDKLLQVSYCYTICRVYCMQTCTFRVCIIYNTNDGTIMPSAFVIVFCLLCNAVASSGVSLEKR
jgi:hypothetical protein